MKTEENTPINWENLRSISIVKTLEKLGFFPSRTTKKAAWFLSPLRSEKEASFTVSLYKNLWYDFGIGEGGSVIELVMALKACSKYEAVKFLQEDTISSTFSRPVEQPQAIEKIKITKVQSFRTLSLIKYLKSRNIPTDIAQIYCKEVWYSFKDKEYFAVGLKNHLGGWELRNRYYKNSSSPKSYTIIRQASNRIVVTEGIFDFLSLAKLEPELIATSDCLILNSLSFVKDIHLILSTYSSVQLYLDNDLAGRKATDELLSLYPSAMDRSGSYSDYADLNDWLSNEETK